MAPVTPTRIVILGGGYAAVRAYRRLQQRLRRHWLPTEVEITILCPVAHHAYHGWTAEVLEGIVRPDHQLSPLDRIFASARLIHGSAASVDLQARVVHAVDASGSPLPSIDYDHLVIATGSREHVERVPGMAEHGIGLKRHGDIERLGHHVRECLLRAGATNDDHERRTLMTFVVVGGGITGVEVCAGLGELMHRERDAFPVLQHHEANIMLIHSGPSILAGWGDEEGRLVRYALKHLRRYGVTVHVAERAAEVTASGVRLESGTLIPTHTVVSTIGQRLQVLPGTEQLARDRTGRLLTDAYLRVAGSDHVWAGGDVASVQHDRTGQPCPANALWAMHHGDQIGENLFRTVRHSTLLKFTYPGFGTVGSLGIGKGFGEVWGHEFTGWIPYLVRSLIFIYYMPSRLQALRVLRDLLSIPFTLRPT